MISDQNSRHLLLKNVDITAFSVEELLTRCNIDKQNKMQVGLFHTEKNQLMSLPNDRINNNNELRYLLSFDDIEACTKFFASNQKRILTFAKNGSEKKMTLYMQHVPIPFMEIGFDCDLFYNNLKRVSSKNQNFVTIGIVGPSGVGKSTLTDYITRFLNFKSQTFKCQAFHSDSYFNTKNCFLDPEIGNYRNMECKEACDYGKMYSDVTRWIQQHVNSKLSESNQAFRDNVTSVLLLEGLLLINSEKLMNLCNIIIFLFSMDDQFCFLRRLKRKKRDPSKFHLFKAYYDKYVWPEYVENRNFFFSKYYRILEAKQENTNNKILEILHNLLAQKLEQHEKMENQSQCCSL
ncbi:nicotinamide riboside kinase [Reticulomyxa filosa]|uniref:Nicotinamide riboside kinase n=1 Tax=Reticulomyxa filosa TaxID=46433 RepID=X6P104_RETFI|nr:nicotinamide riboside kinase [Reticulomyxa filosa]|eukprot:ETO31227.1 nicotinamide riboside kinase [Reticulomyxa filosa]